MQRMNVVLPEPGRADDADRLALRDLERDALQHLEPAEALVHVLRVHDDVVAHRRARTLADRRTTPRRAARGSVSSSPRSLAASRRSIDAWITLQTDVSTRYQNATATKYSTGLNVCRVVDLGVAEELVDADEGEQRRRLQHVVELVAERRDDHARRLRQDDPAHREPVAHPERLRRLHLAAVDRVDAGADDLAHVRALVDARARGCRRATAPSRLDEAEVQRSSGSACTPNSRFDAVVDEEDLHDHRRAAEDEHVEARQPAQRRRASTSA